MLAYSFRGLFCSSSKDFGEMIWDYRGVTYRVYFVAVGESLSELGWCLVSLRTLYLHLVIPGNNVTLVLPFDLTKLNAREAKADVPVFWFERSQDFLCCCLNHH